MNIRHVVSASTAVLLTVIMPTLPQTSGATLAQTSGEREITLVGCIQRESDYRRMNATHGGPLGPGLGLGDEYVLVNAFRTTSGQPAPAEGDVACGTAGVGESFELTGKNEDDLEGFVGRRVEISGMLKDAKIDVVTGRPTGGFDPLGHDLRLFEVNVMAFREPAVAQQAAAAEPAPAAPSAEFEAPSPAAPTAELEAPAEPAAQAEITTEAVSPAEPEPQAVATAGVEEELPRTASPLPLAGLIGLMSLAGAAGLRSLRRRR